MPKGIAWRNALFDSLHYSFGLLPQNIVYCIVMYPYVWYSVFQMKLFIYFCWGGPS